MAIALYMAHQVPRAITNGLRIRGVDVITAYEDNASTLDDAALLARAGELGRVLFTRDDDLLAEAAQHQRNGLSFGGVIYAHQLRVSVGRCIEDLEIIAKLGEPDDVQNRVQYLPL